MNHFRLFVYPGIEMAMGLNTPLYFYRPLASQRATNKIAEKAADLMLLVVAAEGDVSEIVHDPGSQSSDWYWR